LGSGGHVIKQKGTGEEEKRGRGEREKQKNGEAERETATLGIFES